eukprot:NODE_16545_length_989_cov_2.315545.p1 GENE.NODE_16545_length_989_cov_2.315545~~NODE_16545_length_989_cov_2.315545.p1  ORF type:complete len:268 (+),score=65.70 NODE_16545_length_989_cov_2.315545:172-975(+)
MKSISSALIPRIRDFDAQNISNMAWAVARFGIVARPLLDALSSSSIPTISAFNAQNLNNTAWSVAPLGVLDSPLLAAISAASLKKIRDFNTQGSANTVWSYESLGHDTDADAFIAARSAADGDGGDDSGASAAARMAARVRSRGGDLSWSDYAGAVSTHGCGRQAEALEEALTREVLAPALRLFALVQVRGTPPPLPPPCLRLERLRRVHEAPLVRGGWPWEVGAWRAVLRRWRAMRHWRRLVVCLRTPHGRRASKTDRQHTEALVQ